MEKVALLIMVLMITLTGEVIAQDYKKINKLVDKEHYQQAWQLIKQELEVNSDDQTLNYYAGVTKLELYQQQEALSYLLKSNASVNDRYHFYLAKAYFENDQLEEAKQAVSSINRSALSEKETYLITEQFISYEKLRKSPKHVVVKNLGSKINSDSHEYNGVMTQDQKSVLYTVRKTGSNQVAGDGLAYEKIYKTTIDENDEWQEPEVFESYALKNHHDASVALFDNDTKMVTYHDEDLFISELKDGVWTNPIPMDQVNGDGSSETHCFVTTGFDTIFYSTNYYSVKGDLDLYMITRTGDEWSDPVAMEALNSELNDDSPFLAENGDFYFSSQGHNSMGGYDVFRSKFDSESGSWKKPENMGYKINTASDDIYFNTFGKIAYLSSGRAGGYGNMDIYRVFLFDKVNITGQVIDDKTQKAMAGAKISVKGDDATEVYSDELGKYTIEVPIEKVFEMSIEFENQLVYNEQHLANVLFRDYNDNVMHLEVDIAGISEGGQNEPKQIAVKMVNDFETNPVEIATSEEVEEILTLEVITPKDQSILTNNVQIDDENLPAVYFDFNKSALERPFRSQLLKLAKKLVYKSNKNLEIIGHTDLPGAESYNIGLGMKRANEIKEFLVQLGVEEHRMVVSSKGERKPVENINSKSFKNRRAELRLIDLGEEPKKTFAGS
ncbi:MAG: OmpA family protein [Bacteroidota bacterium]